MLMILLAGLLLGPPRNISADTEPGPQDYAIPVGERAYWFVMLVPESMNFSPMAMNPTLRQRYPQSGLYDNRQQPPKLIYPVDWYANQSVPWAWESEPLTTPPRSLATHHFFR